MTKYEERLIEHGSLFSRHAIKKWIAISTAACAFFMLWLGVSISPLTVVFSIAQSIGWLFATGIPFAAGASLLFSSKQTHRNIVEHIESDRKNQFSQLFLSFSVMVMSMMVAAALAAFTITSLVSHQSIIFAILPFIATTLLISLLFCPVFVLVALIVDDTKVSMAIGVVLAIVITMTTGLPGNPINYP
ncbi:MAG: hypothetical protein RTU30_07125, partial [Candidatus Thorarchaeota archaeon]